MTTKRIVFWMAGGIVGLILLVVVGGVLLLNHSQRFRAYLLQRVERSVNESTGAQVAVRDFSVSFRDLHLDLYGIVVHGKESNSQRPLLTADQVSVAIKIDSVLGGKWHLRSMVADRPVASIAVNEAGESNLPAPKQPTQTHINIFELAVAQVAIHDGEIHYNDHEMGFDAFLNDLEFSAAFDPSQSSYHGNLGYRNANIQYGRYAPVTHDLDASFEVTPRNFTLNHAVIATGSSRVVVEGSVEDYAGTPYLQATYDAKLATRDVARILNDSSVPAGDVRLTGLLNYQSRRDRAAPESVRLAGTASSGELQVTSNGVHVA